VAGFKSESMADFRRNHHKRTWNALPRTANPSP
jgi:hypothetical protein